MRAAALKFPNLVAQTPMRTHAVLTKYTSLRSFYSATLGAPKNIIPNFEKAGVYTTMLQEAYLDYKTIAKNLQVLAFSVSAGTEKLLEAPAATKGQAQEKTKANEKNNDSDSDSIVDVDPQSPVTPTAPYAPTLVGLESARQAVRMMLNRIVAEVDAVTRDPDVATNEKRKLPYLSPFLFKDLIPTSVSIAEVSSQPATAETKEADASNIADMADKLGGKIRF
jgi:hypothetical protein